LFSLYIKCLKFEFRKKTTKNNNKQKFAQICSPKAMFCIPIEKIEKNNTTLTTLNNVHVTYPKEHSHHLRVAIFFFIIICCRLHIILQSYTFFSTFCIA